MKPYIFLITLALAFTACDFGSGETATNAPVTEPQDTTLTAKTDNTATPQEVPFEDLPVESKRQDAASQGVTVMVAPGMKVEDLETFILVCSEEVVKDAKCFTLERYDIELPAQITNRVVLKGRHFYYNVVKVENENQEIEGYLKVGNQWFLVKATDKDPNWIFPYLAHVELSNRAL